MHWMQWKMVTRGGVDQKPTWQVSYKAWIFDMVKGLQAKSSFLSTAHIAAI